MGLRMPPRHSAAKSAFWAIFRLRAVFWRPTSHSGARWIASPACHRPGAGWSRVCSRRRRPHWWPQRAASVSPSCCWRWRARSRLSTAHRPTRPTCSAARWRGTASIYLTAEDDAIEVHNRLSALGAIPDRLYVLPLPDAGGAQPLFAPDTATRGPSTTAAWLELERQLWAMTGLRLVVFDPLQPLCALDLKVPENAPFVCSRLAALVARTSAAVIVSHHFAKRDATTPERAREAIRGTGGLVDGVRSVYALWQPKEEQTRTMQDLGRVLRARAHGAGWREGQRSGRPARDHFRARHVRSASGS